MVILANAVGVEKNRSTIFARWRRCVNLTVLVWQLNLLHVCVFQFASLDGDGVDYSVTDSVVVLVTKLKSLYGGWS